MMGVTLSNQAKRDHCIGWEESGSAKRVIRIFPNEDAAMRLIGALLAEKYEVWQAASKYFDMTEYWEWKIEQSCLSVQNKAVVINQ